MKLYATIAYILAFVMTVLAYNPSWSQYADTHNEWLLYLCLGAISMAHIKRNQTFDEITAVMFILVGVFSVNSVVKWVEIAHLVATGLAIISTYISLIVNAKEQMMKVSAYMSLTFGALLFVFGYLFNWYSVAVAELLVSTTLLIPFYKR